MTSDHDERNDIRMYNVIAASIFMAVALSGPLAVQEVLFSAGYSEKFGWAVSGGIFAVATGIGLFISWNGLRGTEPDLSTLEKEKHENIFAIMKKSFKIRAFRQICLMTIIGIIGITVVESMEMYLFKNRIGMSEGTISTVYMLYAVAEVVLVPVITKLMNRFGKREVFIGASLIASVGAIVFWIIGIDTVLQAIIYIIFLFSIFAGVFWTVYVTFAYDVAEIYAYR